MCLFFICDLFVWSIRDKRAVTIDSIVFNTWFLIDLHVIVHNCTCSMQCTCTCIRQYIHVYVHKVYLSFILIIMRTNSHSIQITSCYTLAYVCCFYALLCVPWRHVFHLHVHVHVRPTCTCVCVFALCLFLLQYDRLTVP